MLRFTFLLICVLAKRTEVKEYEYDLKQSFTKILNMSSSTNGFYEHYFKNKRFHTTFHPLSGDFRRHTKIPKTFDARKKWPYCTTIATDYDTGECVTSVGQIVIKVLTDRTCIKTKGRDHFFYSLEDLLTCCALCKELIPPKGSMCNELNYFIASFKHWLSVGLASGGDYHNSSQGCKPYSNDYYFNSTTEKNCSATCTNKLYPIPYEKDRRKGKSLRVIFSKNIHNMKKEMVKYGPVLSMFPVPEDFFYHEEGVYERQYGGIVGYFPIQIIGWGIENSSDKFFWLIYFPKISKKDTKYGVFKISADLHIEDMIFSPQIYKRAHLPPSNEISSSANQFDRISVFSDLLVFLLVHKYHFK